MAASIFSHIYHSYLRSFNTQERREHFPTTLISQKVQGIYQRIKTIHQITHTTSRHLIGSVISKSLLFPLFNTPEKEETCHAQFWDEKCPLNPNLSSQKEIRRNFKRIETSYPIQLDTCPALTIKCPTVQCKQFKEGEKTYVCLIFVDPMTAKNEDISWFYPYVKSYLHMGKTSKIPQAQFILISPHQITQVVSPHCAITLDKIGYILSQLLMQIRADQYIAHSFGAIALFSAFQHAKPEKLAKHICIDRSPTSLEELYKTYPCGNLLSYLAKFSGWSFSMEEEFNTTCKTLKNIHKIFFLVISAQNDPLLNGSANLCNSHIIKRLEVQTLVRVLTFNTSFSPTPIPNHLRGNDRLFASDLTLISQLKNRNFFKKGENLAQAILRSSLISKCAFLGASLDYEEAIHTYTNQLNKLESQPEGVWKIGYITKLAAQVSQGIKSELPLTHRTRQKG